MPRINQNHPRPPKASKNWYAHLHDIAKNRHHSSKRTFASLNLSIFFRIWLAVAVIIIAAGLMVFWQISNHIKPTIQKVIENTLAENAKILAQQFQEPLLSKRIYQPLYQQQLTDQLNDNTSSLEQPLRLYITDQKGKVIYDSLIGKNNATGQDYGRWNDVYLTLQGKYGVRTSRLNPDDEDSSIMYVAQPIFDDKKNIIGVISLGKPIHSLRFDIHHTHQQILTISMLVTLIALIFAGLVAWWLRQSIAMVTHYTQSLAPSEDKPRFYLGHELNQLTNTIESMKHQLENKSYVTEFVHTLTHELKSPLTAIRASAELLENPDIDDDDKIMLSQNITEQSIKLQTLIDRLLLLAKIEQPTFRLHLQPVNVFSLIEQLITQNMSKIRQHHLQVTLTAHNDVIATYPPHIKSNKSTPLSHQQQAKVLADEFWLVQALQNILDNALYFANQQIIFNINVTHHQIMIECLNDGEIVPTFALSKVFERYFSLTQQHKDTIGSQQHQANKTTTRIRQKGTGLGLTLVKQIIERHDGQVSLKNVYEDFLTNDLKSETTTNDKFKHTTPQTTTMHKRHTSTHHNNGNNNNGQLPNAVKVSIVLPKYQGKED